MAAEMSPRSKGTTDEPKIIGLFQNNLILSLIVPNLPISLVLALASTSRSFRSLMYDSHRRVAFRYLDLSILTSPLLHADIRPTEAVMGSFHYRHTTDDMLSVDDYYAAPLRRVFYVFKKKSVLDCVTTLILDGLVVPATLLREILCDEPYNIRILSIRRVKSISEAQIMQVLRYLIRPSRPSDPKLKGLYYFTPSEGRSLPVPEKAASQLPNSSSGGVTSSPGSQLGRVASSDTSNPTTSMWTDSQGNIFHPIESSSEAWAQLLLACQGLIAFDAVVCCHAPGFILPPRLASIALGPQGCHDCHSAPEGPLVFGETPAHKLPLLPPPPLHASTVRAAQSLGLNDNKKFYARCVDCMTDRRCLVCNTWWCEDCYETSNKWKTSKAPEPKIKVHMGFCIQKCLVEQLWTGAGEGGMWG